MINFDDDIYEHKTYNCPECEQKEFVLKESAHEVKQMKDEFMQLANAYSDIQNKLMDNMENVCHMLGIPFMSTQKMRDGF